MKEPLTIKVWQLIIVVLIALMMQRCLAVLCTKMAAIYWSRGDERMANRFQDWATHFARASMMHGEFEVVPPDRLST